MLCRNPFVRGGIGFGCGQCLPCRISKRRIWAHRIMLEAFDHEFSCFATLTYNDENLPSDGSLDPSHLVLFWKRLRKKLGQCKIRYFAVGEYGDVSERPHYHAIIFGMPTCHYGHSRYDKRTIDCCYWCDLIRDTWGLGHILLGSVEKDSASYVAGYTVKKMTGKDDARLLGRHPEFARMSRRPGIGVNAMWEVASSLLSAGAEKFLVDVPSVLSHGTAQMPLGRFLRGKLREMVGRDVKAPQAVLDAMAAELQDVLVRARVRQASPNNGFSFEYLFKEEMIRESQGKALRQELKTKFYEKGRRI